MKRHPQLGVLCTVMAAVGAAATVARFAAPQLAAEAPRSVAGSAERRTALAATSGASGRATTITNRPTAAGPVAATPVPVAAGPAGLAPSGGRAVAAEATSVAALRDEVRRLTVRLQDLEGQEEDRLVEPDAEADGQQLANRAALALEDGRPERARAFLERLLERYPMHAQAPFALYALGTQDLVAGRKDAAGERFARILKDFPEDEHLPYARLQLGILALRKGDGAAAVPELEAAVQGLARDSTYRASALVSLAAARNRLGDATAARSLLDHVVAEFGRDPKCSGPVTHARRALARLSAGR